IYVVSAEGGQPKKITSQEGPDEMPNWSPDGKSIVYVSMLEPKFLWFDQLKISIVPADGGQPRVLTKDLDRNTWNPEFGPDGRVYFLVEDRGTQRLVSMPPAGGDISEATSEKMVYNFDLGPNGSVAFSAVRSDLPGDVFAMTDGKE